MLHKNGANFYYNKGTAIKNWNLILHIGLMSIKAVSWINSTFEKNKFRLTFSWKCPSVCVNAVLDVIIQSTSSGEMGSLLRESSRLVITSNISAGTGSCGVCVVQYGCGVTLL